MEVFKIVLLCLGACGLLAKKFHFEGERNFRELSHSNDKPRNLVQDIASCVAWVHQKSSKPNVQDCAGDTCFEELDCFNACTGTFSYIGLAVQNPAYINSSFMLHIRDNIEGMPLTYYDLSNAFGVIYKPTRIYILVHDFGDSPHGWPVRVKNSILSIDDRACIIVDWRGSFRTIDGSAAYAQAVVNTEIVGRQIAVLLQNLMEDFSFVMKSEYIHFIGHGLGAQMAKPFSEYFVKLTGLAIGRVTALDPMSLLFEEYNNTIDKSTALFVDVVHTSAPNAAAVRSPEGMALRGKVGVVRPIGHLDLYPNGGRRQPGCSNEDDVKLCSHKRAYQYLAAALSSSTECLFASYGCKGGRKEYLEQRCVRNSDQLFLPINLDLNPTSTPRGVQFFEVTQKPPYCM
ncbi:pancreatic lipase-related protein 2-like [Varroa destructor]|uniref:Lipase domain-containing protein n=1 Tax=Varroa destructor TaxID=109461 RepID=A0A7M7JC47_VARDE|nr:pancreatic lipase-related protein 2-like [Varroa destructor]